MKGPIMTHITNEKSPYLRQHANDPVEWYHWCDEAFERAKRENKPIFLSIGYSTCHFCHRMAQESFRDRRVAEILNKNYISVKVDREERPDVDAVYMLFCTALNGSGGSPLTVLMTPEQKPFFVGTYIPRDSSGTNAGLIALLETMAKKWHSDKTALLRTAGEITDYVKSSSPQTGELPDAELPVKAAAQLAASYDSEFGGFGKGTKFPTPQNLLFLMEFSALRGDRNARFMAEATLRQMYRGGIYDHIGGGFARYSTDREWLAPHFEKTLYDNALLALTYTEAWQDGHLALYRSVAENTLDYCLRELKSPSGGFFAGQDADSEGQEGAYYLFTPAEVRSVLGEEEGRHFCECYDITDEGNFRGKSIPNLLLNNRWSLVPEGYDDYREKLRLFRAERMELMTDSKILCSRNGMMLMALSRAGRAFSDRRYLAEAQSLAAFIENNMTHDGKLMARLCEGELRYPATLDDLAFYALGLLELYEADFDPAHIQKAKELADEILAHFAAEQGFYLSSDESEELILRPMEIFDGAAPSGNSAAVVLFSRLHALTGDGRMRDEAEKLLAFISANSEKYSAACPFALTAMLTDEPKRIVCAAPDEKQPEMLPAVRAKYAPELTVLFKTPKTEKALSELAPFTADCRSENGKAAFYIFDGERLSGKIVNNE